MDDCQTNSASPSRKGISRTKCKRRKTVHEHISKGVIRRLARRGGVKRISALIYNESRSILEAYLKSLVRDSVLYCEYFKRKTVQAQDVVRAVRKRGERLYGFDDKPFPISFRTTINLTDSPEESAPSTLEETETAVSETNDGESEILNENIPTTSRRSSENSRDSDATRSDIGVPVERNRSSSLFSDDNEHRVSRSDGDSDSDSLISPANLLAEETSHLTKNREASKNSLKNSELPTQNNLSDVRANENRTNSDNLESTDEINSTSPEKRNSKKLKTSLNDIENTENQNHTPRTRSSINNKRDPLNARRRNLFPHTRNATKDKRNSNENASCSDKVNPNDSDDFEDNLDLLITKNRRSTRRTESFTKNEASVSRNKSNVHSAEAPKVNGISNSEKKKNSKQNPNVDNENLQGSRLNAETNSDPQDISVVYVSLPAGKFSNKS